MPMVNCCSQAGDDVDGTSLEPSWSRVGAVDNADGILLEPSWRRCRWCIFGAVYDVNCTSLERNRRRSILVASDSVNGLLLETETMVHHWSLAVYDVDGTLLKLVMMLMVHRGAGDNVN